MPGSFQRLIESATRLTRSGRLAQATQAIQRALRQNPLGSVSVPNQARPQHSADTPPQPLAILERRDAVPTGGPELEAPVTEGDRLGEGTVLTGEHAEAGLTRSYLLYLPPHHSGNSSVRLMPLVVMLHGCTQDPADFAAGTGMNALARERGFAVLYPAQAQSANPSRCWNWFKHSHQERGHGEPAVLAGMTRAVMAAHAIDPRRVYVAGLSAGGAMAAILGRAYPDLYAAVGIHSGLASGAARDLMSALAAMKRGPAAPHQPPAQPNTGEPSLSLAAAVTRAGPLPTIVFHGDEDAVVHPGNGLQAVAAALAGHRDAGPPAATPQPGSVDTGVSAGGRRYTRSVHSGAAGAPDQAEHWIVHGGGHAWSGGSPQGSYTDPSGPDATREMWRFFSSHRQAVPGSASD